MAYGTPVLLHDLDATAAAAQQGLAADADAVGVLFRVDAVSYAYRPDPYEDDWGTTPPHLEVRCHGVLRWTEHGATLSRVRAGSRPKWVDLRPDAKQWASRSLSEAIEQFARRRRSQIWILERQLSRARYELSLTQSPFSSSRLTPQRQEK